jgi:hypothetical protein
MSIEAKNVAVGSLADMTIFELHVRFTPNGGHLQCTSACPLCANSGHCGAIQCGESGMSALCQ